MNNIIYIPEALVLGCNTPHGINVLSDFIEELTGHPPDFHESGWTSDYNYKNKSRNNYGDFPHSDGNGYGYADDYGSSLKSDDGYGGGTTVNFNEGNGRGDGTLYFDGLNTHYGYGNGRGSNFQPHSSNGYGGGDINDDF